MRFKKWDSVTYGLPAKHGVRVQALVKTVHKDSTYTIQARFILKANGEPVPGFLGYKYRVVGDVLKLERRPS